MVTKQVTSVWTMGGWQPPVGQSFQGFQHQAEDLPNQDAYCIEQYDVTNSTLCVLADGSGGPEAIRSDAGSKIAVQTFRKVIENEIFPLLRKDTLDPAALENTWSLVGKKIEKIWIEECLNHLRENPFSEEENQFRLETDELVERPICAYTTTLSGALLTQEFGLFLHLGDAEIMLTEGAGQTESISQPATEANQTAITLGSIHSLPFHPRVISGSEWQSKELVFLATDGVRDAFPDRDELSQHVSGYLNAWRNKGSHRKLSIMTRDSCHRFASESGSGGDATLLIVKRVQKEDILSRGEFEKAWVDFERNRTNLLAEVSQTRNDLKKELEDISIRLRQSAQSTETDLRKTTENLSRAIESVGNDHRQKVDQLGNSIREHFLSYETGMKENQQEIERLKKNQQFIYPALSAGAFAFVLAVFAIIHISSVSSELKSVSSEVKSVSSEVRSVIKTENNEEQKISLKDVIYEVKEGIEENKNRLGLVDKKNSDVEERLEKLIDDFSGDIDALDQRIRLNANAGGEFTDELAGIRGKLESLQGEISTLKEIIDDLSGQDSPADNNSVSDQDHSHQGASGSKDGEPGADGEDDGGFAHEIQGVKFDTEKKGNLKVVLERDGAKAVEKEFKYKDSHEIKGKPIARISTKKRAAYILVKYTNNTAVLIKCMIKGEGEPEKLWRGNGDPKLFQEADEIFVTLDGKRVWPEPSLGQ